MLTRFFSYSHDLNKKISDAYLQLYYGKTLPAGNSELSSYGLLSGNQQLRISANFKSVVLTCPKGTQMAQKFKWLKTNLFEIFWKNILSKF